MHDPYIDGGPCPFNSAGVYFVATNHKQFADEQWKFPAGSVVIDPWRYIPKQDGFEVIHVGVGDHGEQNMPVVYPQEVMPLGSGRLARSEAV